ncbi:DEKNAAC105042 [Brettanomyces naardenensis]|uniref:DEKNAAC105042 n=1 Tax=Brettanomyces naardenensis TaxID=13370 RepID=A0A448YSD6_BRENA|nr:DEKNAAC105042 [Brettanomyces naardenensis]
MTTDLERCLDGIISKLHSPAPEIVGQGLEGIDKLLYDFCILANPNSSKNKTIRPHSSTSNNSRRSHHSRHSSRRRSTTSSANSSSSSSREPSLYSSPSLSTYTDSPSSSVSSPGSQSSSNFIGTRKWRIPSATDPVFGEFIRLQDSFQYNLVSQLVIILAELERGKNRYQTNISFLLKDLQGCLLLHPGSRKVFLKDYNLRLLLDLLDPTVDNSILIKCIPVLVSCMVRDVKIIRLFEELEGPRIVCNLLKAKAEEDPANENNINYRKEVQVKVLEFLFFYLIPESQSSETEETRRIGGVIGRDGVLRRHMESKIEVLNEYLNTDVTDSLVRELVESRPFGKMKIDW